MRPGRPGASVMIWLQVRDVHAEHRRLAAAGARVRRGPVAEPWGLVEMWIEDLDSIPIVLTEFPASHPRGPGTRRGLYAGRRLMRVTAATRIRPPTKISVPRT
jgi:hypothetical protein